MHRRRIPTAHTFARTRSRFRRILRGGPSRAHGESHDHTQAAPKIPRSHSHPRAALIRTSSRWPPARRERLDLTSSLGPPARLTPDFTSAECKAFLPLESIPAISSSCAARFLQFGYTATLIIGGVSLTSPSLIPAHIDAHARGSISGEIVTPTKGRPAPQDEVLDHSGLTLAPRSDFFVDPALHVRPARRFVFLRDRGGLGSLTCRAGLHGPLSPTYPALR